jgi:hypothetical protein
VSSLRQIQLEPDPQEDSVKTPDISAADRPHRPNGRHAHRIALVAGISGSTLQNLTEIIAQQLPSPNGNGRCPRLKSGSVDCSCDYCESYWSLLAENLGR